MIKTISFPYLEDDNKSIKIIKSLFFNSTVERLRKNIKFEGIKANLS